MSFITSNRVRVLAAGIAAVTAAGIGIASASTSSTPSNGIHVGKGVDEFGMTKSFYDGHTVNFTYTKGFYCDTSVKSAASSGCEAGVNYNKPPAKDFDPLYITVPLGNFASKLPGMSMECPAGLICVDHPGTIDLSALESTIHTIAPYSADSNAALTAALKNFMTPGHEHFITTTNGGQAEWWDVKVVAVTSLAEWKAINKHASYSFLANQIKAKKAVGPIDTNLVLYFAAK